jgi:hypothetical protein
MKDRIELRRWNDNIDMKMIRRKYLLNASDETSFLGKDISYF